MLSKCYVQFIFVFSLTGSHVSAGQAQFTPLKKWESVYVPRLSAEIGQFGTAQRKCIEGADYLDTKLPQLALLGQSKAKVGALAFIHMRGPDSGPTIGRYAYHFVTCFRHVVRAQFASHFFNVKHCAPSRSVSRN